MIKFFLHSASMLLCFALMTIPAAAQAQALIDSDNDGLPDVWETDGVAVMVNGQEVRVDLRAMGADPRHKDLFVEIDYMSGGGHSHKPKQEALAQSIKAFASAPVSNPDNTPGINIHIDAGPDTVMDARPGKGTLWGTLSRSNAFAEAEFLLPAGDVPQPLLGSTKATNFDPARAQIFRYVVFVHHLGLDRSEGGKGGSGIADGIPGIDSIVSLGGWTADVGSVPEQAGTFVHELGHTLGLRHGGSDDIHRKPNYLSVMNYLFQTSGVRVNGTDYNIDLSRSKLADLNENALNESDGVGPAQSPPMGTRWHLAQAEKFVNVTSPIDWNQNSNSAEGPYALDLNNDNQLAVLTGFEDWNNISFRPIGAARSTLTSQVASASELTKEQADAIPHEYELAVDIENELRAVAPGAFAEYTLKITNTGDVADTYQITTHSSLGWANFTGIPTQLQLDPKGEQTFTYKVNVPANALEDQTDESLLLVRSTGAPMLADEAEALTTATAATTGATGTTGAGGRGCSETTQNGGTLALMLLVAGVLILRRHRRRP